MCSIFLSSSSLERIMYFCVHYDMALSSMGVIWFSFLFDLPMEVVTYWTHFITVVYFRRNLISGAVLILWNEVSKNKTLLEGDIKKWAEDKFPRITPGFMTKVNKIFTIQQHFVHITPLGASNMIWAFGKRPQTSMGLTYKKIINISPSLHFSSIIHLTSISK